MHLNHDTDEIVLATFNLDDIHFALSTRYVQEAIIMESSLVPWPSSQDYVEGVMDLRGNIVPVINLKKRLGRPRTEYDNDCRIAVVGVAGMTVGVLFDGVKDVIRTSQRRIEIMNEALQGKDRVIAGVLNHTETGRLIEIIDPRRLVLADFNDEFEEVLGEQDTDSASDKIAAKTVQLVVFSQDGCEYAVDVESVREIEVVESVDRTFRSALIHGSVTVHDCQLPLIHLGSLDITKNREVRDYGDGQPHPQSVIILTLNDVLCAVAIDAVREIVTVKESDILTMSVPVDDAFLGVIQRSEGRSILVLKVSAAFRNHLQDIESMNKIFKRDSILEFKERKQKASLSTDALARNYLFFEVEELFALELQNVQEILPPMDLIVPPFLHRHMEGILNLRKTLMPQYSLRSFLGYSARSGDEPDTRKIIVLKSKEYTVALVVENILNFSSSLRETPVPTLGPRLNLIKRVFKSLIVSTSEFGQSRHALHIDPDTLIQELVSRNQHKHPIKEAEYVGHTNQHP